MRTRLKREGKIGKDDDGSNSVCFENFQRELKQHMIIYIHQMYTYMHTATMALDAIKEGVKGVDKLKESVAITVSLPGMPDEATLNRLFMQGVLKYESFVQYLSAKHSIPLECFEKKPILTIQGSMASHPRPQQLLQSQAPLSPRKRQRHRLPVAKTKRRPARQRASQSNKNVMCFFNK